MAKEEAANELLERIGLTRQESRVYLALAEMQDAGSAELCRKTGIASSNIYSVLESLIAKGLASYRVQNNVKRFMPSPPDALNDLFLEKQKRLEGERREVARIVSQLKKHEPSARPRSEYKYYEGLGGVKAMWHEINFELRNKPNACECIYGAKSESYRKLLKFYDEHHAERLRSRIPARIILAPDATEIAAKRTNRMTQVRFAPLGNDAEWGVVGDYYYTQYVVGGTPRAFLIHDPVFASSYRDVFEQVWKHAKPARK